MHTAFPIRWRRFLHIIPLLLMSGCAEHGGDLTSDSESGGPRRAGEGGTATMLFWQAPTVMNPYLTGSAKEVYAASLVIEPLAEYDESGDLVPALAAEIPTVENGLVSPDRTTITWRLRPGVVWSDGTPLTASDVAFTWRYCTAPGLGCSLVHSFEGVTAVEAVDDQTVRVTFDGPKPYPYAPFVTAASPILQEAQFRDCLDARVECSNENFFPVGTGPYNVADFRTNDTVRFTLNPNYRGVDAGQPFFGEVNLKGGGDAAAAARSVLQLGEADFAPNLQVEPEILASMEAAGQRGRIVSAFGVSVEHLMLNQTNPDPALGERRSEYADGTNPHPFLTEPAVGRALSLAIDRPTLVAVGYGDLAGKPACAMWPPFERNEECPAQNMELARRVLDQAGVVDSDGDGVREHEGTPLDLLFQTSTNTVRQTTQELLKTWWDELGIRTELKNVDPSVYFGNDQASPDTATKFYADIQMFMVTSPHPDPEYYFGRWMRSAIPTRDNAFLGNNVSRFYSDEYATLYAELQQTMDAGRREELTSSLDDVIVDSHALIPLVHRGRVSAVASGIEGMRMNAWDSELWNFEEWTRR